MDDSKATTSKREYWKAQLEKQIVSGLSQREYCRREGISYSRFHYWKVREQGAQRESSKLVRVPVQLVEPAAPTVEVLVDGRFIVRVGVEITEEHLARVIRGLESIR